MHYEINVSLNGIHFFATARKSITTEWELVERHKVIKEKFPESEGYKVTVTKWETTGRNITL
jgi:acid stress-induced BolA-like protein IbaG/YrbA